MMGEILLSGLLFMLLKCICMTATSIAIREVQQMLIVLEQNFWNCVQNMVRPEMDASNHLICFSEEKLDLYCMSTTFYTISATHGLNDIV